MTGGGIVGQGFGGPSHHVKIVMRGSLRNLRITLREEIVAASQKVPSNSDEACDPVQPTTT